MKPDPKVSDFQNRVYQLCSQIPCGKFTTYKALSDALNSSPRAVGQALKRNPFAPTIPCHRVLASNFYIGGFHGHRDLASEELTFKKNLLTSEGLLFDNEGFLVLEEREQCFFDKFVA